MENKITDCTDFTPAVFEAFLEAKTGNPNVDCSKLSTKECYQLANAMGWEMTSRVIHWCEFNGS
jgi:hypothetical protein